MEAMIEKMIELVGQVQDCGCDVTDVVEMKYVENEVLVDHLIDNGVLLLPCKIGDTVYVITYCRCGKPECYDKQHCYKKETARTPKVLASKMVQQRGWKTVWNGFGGIDKQKSGWQPKGTICYRVYQKPFELNMLANVGKTVFLTLEDAEQALAKGE